MVQTLRLGNILKTFSEKKIKFDVVICISEKCPINLDFLNLLLYIPDAGKTNKYGFIYLLI